jgi:hypothetical protein
MVAICRARELRGRASPTTTPIGPVSATGGSKSNASNEVKANMPCGKLHAVSYEQRETAMRATSAAYCIFLAGHGLIETGALRPSKKAPAREGGKRDAESEGCIDDAKEAKCALASDGRYEGRKSAAELRGSKRHRNMCTFFAREGLGRGRWRGRSEAAKAYHSYKGH